jgi:hypothetical protein
LRQGGASIHDHHIHPLAILTENTNFSASGVLGHDAKGSANCIGFFDGIDYKKPNEQS